MVILGVGAGLVFWKSKVGSHSPGGFNSLTKSEIELLIKDVAKQNPMALQRFEDPETRKKQLEDLKQLLAFASQAEREGLANEPLNRQELENIRAEITAASYDREINADKGPMPPFGFITEDRVQAFWAGGDDSQKSFFEKLKDKIGLGKRDNELAFNKFLDTKIAILKATNPSMQDRKISDEEREQARKFFAEVSIYDREFNEKAEKGELPKEFVEKVGLQIRLQQAQFLARAYSEKAAEKVKVTDEDVSKYIAEHPEFDTSQKRAKAEEILQRALAGDDFAALADEFSEDPGNNAGEDGKKRGGLYESVGLGRMVKPFEEAALALEPGQIAPNLVESDFGYHIIKLEKKTVPAEGEQSTGQTYDVRHILISTGYKDPENPFGREEPVKSFVRRKLEDERQKKMIEDIIAKNSVHVPEDFDVPKVSEAEIEESMKRQRQQMGITDEDENASGPDQKEAPKKPAPKKGK